MGLIGYLLISLIVLGLDQWVKWEVNTHIALNTTVNFIPHFLSLSNVRNSGAAWSMFSGHRSMFIIIAIGALIIMTILLIKNKSDKLFALSLTLMIGGTLGNFIDRLRLGYVIDMFTFDFINFPIFNVADCALTIGVVLLLIALFTGDDDEKF